MLYSESITFLLLQEKSHFHNKYESNFLRASGKKIGLEFQIRDTQH